MLFAETSHNSVAMKSAGLKGEPGISGSPGLRGDRGADGIPGVNGEMRTKTLLLKPFDRYFSVIETFYQKQYIQCTCM